MQIRVDRHGVLGQVGSPMNRRTLLGLGIGALAAAALGTATLIGDGGPDALRGAVLKYDSQRLHLTKKANKVFIYMEAKLRSNDGKLVTLCTEPITYEMRELKDREHQELRSIVFGKHKEQLDAMCAAYGVTVKS